MQYMFENKGKWIKQITESKAQKQESMFAKDKGLYEKKDKTKCHQVSLQ